MKEKSGSLIVTLCGALALGLGYLILFGWWIDNHTIVQAFAHLPIVQYNSAVCFFLSGIALLMAYRYRHVSLYIGIVIILIAGLTISQYLFHVNLWINKLFVLPHMQRFHLQAGPMTLNSSISFLLAGLAFIVMSRVVVFKYMATSTLIMGFLILTISAVALLGFAMGVPSSNYNQENFGSMAFQSAFGFIILAIGIIANSWRLNLVKEINIRLFLPIAAFLCGCLVFLLLWNALLAKEYRSIRKLVTQETQNVAYKINSLLIKEELPNAQESFTQLPSESKHQFINIAKAHIVPVLHALASEGFDSSVTVEGQTVYQPENINEEMSERLGTVTNIKVHNAVFNIKIWPKEALLEAQLSWYPDLTLIAGLIISSLLALLLYFWQSVRERENNLQIEISQRKKAEEELQHAAYYDFLTGLSNRFLFEKNVENALARAKRYERVIGICAINLDGFEEINEGLGREVGDELIKVIAHRFSKCIRDSDVLARFGGDQFAILLDEMVARQDADLVAHRVIRSLSEPITIRGHQINVSASLGIAVYPEAGTAVGLLIKNAETAMNRTKKQGGNSFQYFTPAGKEQNEYRYKLESGLHQALIRKEFSLVFQPIVDVVKKKVAAFETLIRWHHPELGWISPADFIPVAEELGLIVPIGEWVLTTACQQYHQWRKQGLDHFQISVNLAVPQLMQADLSERIKDILQITQMQPSDLKLEITETSVMHYMKKASITLKALQELGMEILLDDFGTGYSSLTYLHELPISGLKIDKSFTTNMIEEAGAAKIVATIIQLAQSLNIKVIAEGVESVEQLKFLYDHQCYLIQGYLFGEPLKAEAVADYVKKPFPVIVMLS